MKTTSLKIAVLATALAAVVSAALRSIHAHKGPSGPPIPLTPEMFHGYEFTLISDKDYMDYIFRYGNSVSETFGNKNGAAVGMDEGWRIDNTNTLVFTGVEDMTPAGSTNPANSGFENPVRHTLQFKSFSNDIVVTTYGQKFTRSRLPVSPPDGP